MLRRYQVMAIGTVALVAAAWLAMSVFAQQGHLHAHRAQAMGAAPSPGTLWDSVRQGLFGPAPHSRRPQPGAYGQMPGGYQNGMPAGPSGHAPRTQPMPQQQMPPAAYRQPQSAGPSNRQGMHSQSQPRDAQGTMNQGTMNQGTMNQGAMHQGTMPSATAQPQGHAAMRRPTNLTQQQFHNAQQRLPSRPAGQGDPRVGSRPIGRIPNSAHDGRATQTHSGGGTASRGPGGSPRTTAPAGITLDESSQRNEPPSRRARTEERSITADTGINSSRRTTAPSTDEGPQPQPARPTPAGDTASHEPADTEAQSSRPVASPEKSEAPVRPATAAAPANTETSAVARESRSPGQPEPIAPRVALPAAGHEPTPVDNVLFRRLGPSLVVETLGPRRIVVGKEAVYRVVLRNLGDVAAGQAEVTVQIPPWADVAGVTPSRGKMHVPVPSRAEEGMQWHVPGLRPGGSEDLMLRLVPRESRALELAVTLQSAAIDSQFSVEVREPKLQLAISGPKEVRYGEKAVYELTFSNPGSADAENVLVRLFPIDPGDEADTHEIGTVPANSKQSVEIELVARQPGTLSIRAEATAESGLRSEALREVTVLKPELKVEVTGPKFRYARTVATYQVKVSNPGNAVARGVQVGAMLPGQANFVSASGGGEKEDGANNIRWKAPDLPPGGEHVFELRCELETGGTNRIQVAALAEADLRDTAFIATDVEALADVDLDVNDPKGPLPAGEDVTYEVIIRNRGSKSADNVQVFAYFSEGIEPVQVLGQRHQIESGKVSLQPIPKLGPGEQVVARIIARATKPGNHLFRAEVQCPSLESKLSEQKTTRFYGEEQSLGHSLEPREDAVDATSAEESSVEPTPVEPAEKLTPSRPKPVEPGHQPSFLPPRAAPGEQP